MKNRLFSLIVVAICHLLLAGAALAEVVEKDVTDLVDHTVANLATDSSGTIEKIIGGEHPYKNKDNKALYVFVYDPEVTIVAHPKKVLVGKSYKGKPDVKGKKFRDEIVEGALANETGWVTYSYTKPEETGIHQKKTYFKKCTGSDGTTYVVCAGMYAK